MELPSKLIEEVAFNTRLKIEDHRFVVMYKSVHEEHLSQPLQTKNKQFQTTVTFLTSYKGVFKASDKNNIFQYKRSISDDDFKFINKTGGAYDNESLNDEIKRIIIKECYFTDETYRFLIKPNFSTLRSFAESKQNFKNSQSSFTPSDCLRNQLEFDSVALYEKYKLSPSPVDILSFDKIFLGTNIAQGMIFKRKRSEINHNFTMDVDLGYKSIEELRGGVQWYMMQSKDFISSISFIFEN